MSEDIKRFVVVGGGFAGAINQDQHEYPT
jgi:hypothetical protein